MEQKKYFHGNYVYRFTPTFIGLWLLDDPLNYDPDFDKISFLPVDSYTEDTMTLTLGALTTSYYEGNRKLYITSELSPTIVQPTTPDGYVYQGRQIAFDTVNDQDPVDKEVLDNNLTLIENTNTIAGNRMYDYYPEVVKNVSDISAVVMVAGRELDHARARGARLGNNAFLRWMDENRISEWERALGMRRLNDDTLEMRRNAILSKLRGQNKFNEKSIKEIVKTFTGHPSKVEIENNVITVTITPQNSGQIFNQDSLIRELQLKCPAHMRLVISRFYSDWGDVSTRHDSWKTIYDSYLNWDSVKNQIYG